MSLGVMRSRKIFFENGCEGSYLVVEALPDSSFKSFQMEMIIENNIPGILPFDQAFRNDTCFFRYKITSHLSLGYMLKRKGLIRQQFINLIGNISETFSELSNYLLSENCLILEPDYIFINPATFEAKLIYLPDNYSTDMVSLFKEFVMNIVTSGLCMEDSQDGFFLQKILSGLKSEPFSISEFLSSLDTCEDTIKENYSIKENSGTKVKNTDNFIDKAVTVNPEGNADNKYKNSTGSTKNENISSDEKAQDKFFEINMPESKKKHAVICLQAVFIIIAVLTLYLLNTGAVKILETVIGISVILIADLMLLIAIIKKGKGKTEISDRQGQPQEAENIGLQNESESDRLKGLMNEKANTEYQTFLGNDIGKPMFSNINGSDETEVLAFHDVADATYKKEFAKLQYLENGMLQKVLIEKPVFIIGRMDGQVDLKLQNKAVGKLHAEIIRRNENWYMKDLNSRNGSLINGEKIDSNKEFILKNEDKISLAGTDVIFYSA